METKRKASPQPIACHQNARPVSTTDSIWKWPDARRIKRSPESMANPHTVPSQNCRPNACRRGIPKSSKGRCCRRAASQVASATQNAVIDLISNSPCMVHGRGPAAARGRSAKRKGRGITKATARNQINVLRSAGPHLRGGCGAGGPSSAAAGGSCGSGDTFSPPLSDGRRGRPFGALRERRRCRRGVTLRNSICGRARPIPHCLRGFLSSAT